MTLGVNTSKPVVTIALNQIGEIVTVGSPIAGKVRDSYTLGNQSLYRAIVTTDRISAFDRVIGLVPGKGAMLNSLSAWWFEQLNDIVPNHFLTLPHPNVMCVRQAKTLPIEVVVRGYITGSTSTSLWTLYDQGQRHAYGITLPEGLKKNDKLLKPVITPTTKANLGAHDEPISGDAIVSNGLVSLELWQQIQVTALALFTKGQLLADAAGLILVDTKYEFGIIDGQLALIDEVHTPDSSRYWNKTSYQANPSTPYSYDKEQLRLWLASKGYRGEGKIPVLDTEIINTLQNNYAFVVDSLTKHTAKPVDSSVAAIHTQVQILNKQYSE
jgi:phosphoribosylaminoimidazole-succinocarboxamide synthase